MKAHILSCLVLVAFFSLEARAMHAVEGGDREGDRDDPVSHNPDEGNQSGSSEVHANGALRGDNDPGYDTDNNGDDDAGEKNLGSEGDDDPVDFKPDPKTWSKIRRYLYFNTEKLKEMQNRFLLRSPENSNSSIFNREELNNCNLNMRVFRVQLTEQKRRAAECNSHFREDSRENDYSFLPLSEEEEKDKAELTQLITAYEEGLQAVNNYISTIAPFLLASRDAIRVNSDRSPDSSGNTTSESTPETTPNDRTQSSDTFSPKHNDRSSLSFLDRTNFHTRMRSVKKFKENIKLRSFSLERATSDEPPRNKDFFSSISSTSIHGDDGVSRTQKLNEIRKWAHNTQMQNKQEYEDVKDKIDPLHQRMFHDRMTKSSGYVAWADRTLNTDQWTLEQLCDDWKAEWALHNLRTQPLNKIRFLSLIDRRQLSDQKAAKHSVVDDTMTSREALMRELQESKISLDKKIKSVFGSLIQGSSEDPAEKISLSTKDKSYNTYSYHLKNKFFRLKNIPETPSDDSNHHDAVLKDHHEEQDSKKQQAYQEAAIWAQKQLAIITTHLEKVQQGVARARSIENPLSEHQLAIARCQHEAAKYASLTELRFRLGGYSFGFLQPLMDVPIREYKIHEWIQKWDPSWSHEIDVKNPEAYQSNESRLAFFLRLKEEHHLDQKWSVQEIRQDLERAKGSFWGQKKEKR